jgi:hypothetical protein
MQVTSRGLVRAAIVGALLVVAAFACSDSSRSPNDAPSTADASAEVATTDVSDAGTADAELIFDAPPPCLPIEPPSLEPSWGVFKHRDECTLDLVNFIVRCTFGDPLMPVSKCATLRQDPAWDRCAGCLLGEEGIAEASTLWETPLIVHRGIARVNVAGCLALVTDNPSLSGCTGDLYGMEQCRAAACEQCADGGPESYEGCRTRARSGAVCATHRVSSQCALQADEAGCGVGNDFLSAATEIGRRFCVNPDASDD